MSNDDDIIPVEEPKKDEDQPQEVYVEPPVEKVAFSDPFGKVEKDYKHKDRTISVIGCNLTDEEIVEALKSKEESLISDNASKDQVEKFGELIEAFQEIIATSFPNKDFRDIFNKLKGDITQKVTGDQGKNIMINNPTFQLSKTNGVMEGANAVRFLSSAVKVGNVTRIPLWHSGVVITIDSFKERSLLNFHQNLIRQRMDLGTNTKGAIYSGDDIIVTTAVVEFILEHIIDCSMLDWDHNKLKKIILTHDISSLIAGALASIYPKGYPVFHQCINTLKGACDYSIEAKRTEDLGDYLPDTMLDFRKVLWVDQSKLTLEDKIFMSSNKPTHKYEDIIAYQKRVNHNNKYIEGVEVFKNDAIKVSVNFKISNLEDYFTICNDWCTRVSDMVDKTMLTDTTSDEKKRLESRNDLLNQYAMTVNLIRQSNWIDFIRVVDVENFERKITDIKTIQNSLEVFGGVDDFLESFNKKAQEFKEDSLFAFTGYPNYQCPKCGTSQTEENSKYPTLIPMNMISYFFILMVWRNRTKTE